MTDSTWPLKIGKPLFRLNWCLLAVWLALATFGRTPVDAVYYGALGLHVLVALVEPLLELAKPFVRWSSLALSAAVVLASLLVSADAMRQAAQEDVLQTTTRPDEGTFPPEFEDGDRCDVDPPEV